MSWLQKYYEGNSIPATGESVPLTQFSQLVLEHAFTIYVSYEDEDLNSVHLLLALLCVQSEITAYINCMGIIYEDIVERYYGKSMEKINPEIPVWRDKPFNKLQLGLMNAASKKEKLDKIHWDATYLYSFGLYDQCLKVCDAGLSIDPKHIELRSLKVDCYAQKLEPGPGIALLKEMRNPVKFSCLPGSI